tara:strand:- start:1924 stop:2265 length:342 start_codon:yes stop_codon:yes gene_type:complete
MKLKECQRLGELLSSSQIDAGLLNSIFDLDKRIEKYFLLWCEIIEEEEAVMKATDHRMVNKYGQGWEVNHEVLPQQYRVELNIAGQELLGDDYDPDDYTDISINNLKAEELTQ